MQTMSPTTSTGPIQLRYNGGQVVVTPEDKDRFVMGSQHAISACQGAVAFDRFVEQFKNDFLRPLYTWCCEHKDSIQACYVPLPFSSSPIKVFMVAKSAKFDFALSDAIADVELEFQEDRWPCDVLQISSGSPEELQVFFDPAQSLQVYGHGDSSSAPGKS